MNYKDIYDIEFDDIRMGDYPDFCDAYISAAMYKGRELTEKELDELNEDDDFVYEALINRII